eukprot:TRINITY_DN114888_c0_g1_i1.p1 TRINITY_DN114888_c0_g1~~TRINITY_DN114888_c0_g1_i1.p1  ORF type:complete len:251 (-),score=40.30 TRINITY_DN114888_c0_g1_i1:359-1060(-)
MALRLTILHCLVGVAFSENGVVHRGGSGLAGLDDGYDYENVRGDYEFEEGNEFIEMIFPMKGWYDDDANVPEERLDVSFSETRLSHGVIGRKPAFDEPLLYKARPQLSTWEIRKSSKGERHLILKVKKHREGVTWGDCCPGGEGEDAESADDGKPKQIDGGKLRSKSQRTQSDDEQRTSPPTARPDANEQMLMYVLAGITMICILLTGMLVKMSLSAEQELSAQQLKQMRKMR